MKILVVNGPNINMLGIREPEIYGTTDYQTLLKMISKWSDELGLEAKCFQSNCEGKIVTEIQSAYKKFDGIIINAAAYTHTSIAIPDAIRAVSIPSVEVHISDTNAREVYRRINYVAGVCEKSFIGFGLEGYKMALEYFANRK